MKADNAGLGDAAQSHHPSCAGEHPSPLTARDGEDLRRWNRSEKHQNFSEGVPAGRYGASAGLRVNSYHSPAPKICIRNASSGSTSEVRVRGLGGFGRTHRTPSGGEEEAWMRVNALHRTGARVARSGR